MQKQIESEFGAGISWDEKVEKAELAAGAAKEDYDNIHSWIDFFIELDEGNVGACVTY